MESFYNFASNNPVLTLLLLLVVLNFVIDMTKAIKGQKG